MSQNHYESLAELILPEGVLEYFDITSVYHCPTNIWISLEEKNIFPKECGDDKLLSKGFLPEITVQDFPVRGKEVLYFIKRRRWYNSTKQKTVTRQWNLVGEGTRMTKEFATFLKEVSRYHTD